MIEKSTRFQIPLIHERGGIFPRFSRWTACAVVTVACSAWICPCLDTANGQALFLSDLDGNLCRLRIFVLVWPSEKYAGYKVISSPVWTCSSVRDHMGLWLNCSWVYYAAFFSGASFVESKCWLPIAYFWLVRAITYTEAETSFIVDVSTVKHNTFSPNSLGRDHTGFAW